MAQYKLEIKNKAIKELEKLHPDIGMKILQSIETLPFNPRTRQSHKLRGSSDSCRLRVGDYRVLYQIDDDSRQIMVYHVGHRRDVYRE
jgi:mRNA interferase RelE/StbE